MTEDKPIYEIDSITKGYLASPVKAALLMIGAYQ